MTFYDMQDKPLSVGAQVYSYDFLAYGEVMGFTDADAADGDYGQTRLVGNEVVVRFYDDSGEWTEKVSARADGPGLTERVALSLVPVSARERRLALALLGLWATEGAECAHGHGADSPCEEEDCAWNDTRPALSEARELIGYEETRRARLAKIKETK